MCGCVCTHDSRIFFLDRITDTHPDYAINDYAINNLTVIEMYYITSNRSFEQNYYS